MTKTGKRRVSQKARILKYMKSGKSIHTLRAFNTFGATRLSAVMYSLKEDGYRVKSHFTPILNRFGHRLIVKSYRLVA